METVDRSSGYPAPNANEMDNRNDEITEWDEEEQREETSDRTMA
jgi:hypothetical protein